MCQLCDEAKLYMAQLEAADRKGADARDEAGRKDGATALAASASGRTESEGDVGLKKIVPKTRVH